MTGLQFFIMLDVALLAALIHWRVARLRKPPPDEAPLRLRPASPRPAVTALPRPAPSQPSPNLQSFGGKVHIIDGDTIVVNRTRVRLFGMDAPEMSQRGGARAKSQLFRIAGGKQVRVLPIAVDCYGRIVGRVLLGEIDLSHAMVREGFAVAMRAYHSDYISAEEAARRERRGLWAEGGIQDPAAHRRWKTRHDLTGARPRLDGNVVRLRPPPTL